MAELRTAKDAVLAATRWGDKMRKLLPANKRMRDRTELPTLSALRSLANEGQGLPLQPHEAQTVDIALKSGEDFTVSARAMLKRKASRAELVEMVESGRTLAVQLVEVDQLSAVLTRADAWSVQAKHALATDAATIKAPYPPALRELISTGESLHMEVPEQLAQLHLRIQKQTCSTAIARAVAGNASVAIISNLLVQAEQLHISSAGVDELKGRLEFVQRWEEKAEKARASSASSLWYAIGASQPRKVQFCGRFAHHALSPPPQLKIWAAQAVGAHVAVEEAESILQEAVAFTAAQLPSQARVAKAVEMARGWMAKARVAHDTCSRSRPVTKRRTNTQSAAKARPNGETLMRAEDLERLVAEGAELAVACPQMQALKDRLRQGEEWRQQVGGGLQRPGGAVMWANLCLAQAGEALQTAVTEQQPAALQALLYRAEELGMALEAVGPLEDRVRVLEWAARAAALLQEKSTTAALRNALRAGRALSTSESAGVVTPVLVQLEERVESAEGWEKRARQMLNDGVVQGEELEALIEEGRSMRVILEEMRALEGKLSEHRAWMQSATRILDRAVPHGTQRPTIQQVEKLLQGSAGIATELLADCQRVVEEPVAWLVKCRKQLVKRGRTDSLEAVLAALKSSSDRVRISPKLEKNPADMVGGTATRGLYCLCQRKYNDSEMMIECDGCGEWYHPPCVGTTATALKNVKRYDCPLCLASQVLTKLRREWGALKLPLTDELIVTALNKRHALATGWIARAAAVVQDLEVPVKQIEPLLEEGRSLPLSLKEELKELEERCEIYCVCHQPYDDERGMIACDHCDGWFHYECVGVPSPDDTGKAPPEEYMCQQCCSQRSLPYPYPEAEPETAHPADPDVEEVVEEGHAEEAMQWDAGERDARPEAEYRAQPAEEEVDADRGAERDAAGRAEAEAGVVTRSRQEEWLGSTKGLARLLKMAWALEIDVSLEMQQLIHQ
eukprot:gene7772-9238_t